MARKKSDKVEIAKRIEEILRIRLDGAQRHDILQYASEKGWRLTDRQIDTYIRRADDLLVEQQATKRKRVIALHLAKRGSLYARAINAGDFGTALRVLDSECKLRGLFPESGARELAKVFVEQSKQIAELEAKLVVYKRTEEESKEERETPETPPDGDGEDASGERE